MGMRSMRSMWMIGVMVGEFRRGLFGEFGRKHVVQLWRIMEMLKETRITVLTSRIFINVVRMNRI